MYVPRAILHEWYTPPSRLMIRRQQRVLCGLAAALAAVLLLPALVDARVPGWERLIVAARAGTAALAPRAAALIVVATVAGWTGRRCEKAGSRTLPSAIWAPLLMTAVLLMCSAIVVSASSTTASPRALHAAVIRAVRGDYFVDGGALDPAGMALVQLEALMLFAGSTALAMDTPAFVAAFTRMLVAGAAAAALMNLQRFAQIALRSDVPLETMRNTLRTVRINVSYGDVNAAGSFFALASVVAARLSCTRRRAAVIGMAATAVIVAAMWLTGSRAAVAAFLVACIGLLLMTDRAHRTGIAIPAGLAACAAAAILFVWLFPNRVAGSGTSLGWLTRVEMAKVSVRMTADYPWFGVGVGRFYDMSAAYLPSTRLAGVYPQENAHNNYLQVLAELGIVGSAMVLWLAVAACRYALRGLRNAGKYRVALVGGVAAFSATMVFGDPLLTPEVCYVFALAAGIASGAGIQRDDPVSGRRLAPIVASVGVIALAATVPFRVHAASASANLEQVAWGTGPWRVGDDGVRARPMLGEATLFIPSEARLVEIPLRLERPGPPVALSIIYRQRVVDRIVVTSTAWSRYRLMAGSGKSESRYDALTLLPDSGDSTNVLVGKLVEY